MTTYRTLAGAAAFHRRRLVAAFMSGSPEGPHLEPPRSGRCVVGGLLLAAALMAGTVVYGQVTGHPRVDWDRAVVHLSH